MENDGHSEIIWKNKDFIFKTTVFFVYNFLFYRRRELLRRCDASLQLPHFSVTAYLGKLYSYVHGSLVIRRMRKTTLLSHRGIGGYWNATVLMKV